MALADLTIAAATSWWISQQVKTPNTGEPGTWNTNPNSGQERKYGPKGNPEADIDWNHDHGAGSITGMMGNVGQVYLSLHGRKAENLVNSEVKDENRSCISTGC